MAEAVAEAIADFVGSLEVWQVVAEVSEWTGVQNGLHSSTGLWILILQIRDCDLKVFWWTSLDSLQTIMSSPFTELLQDKDHQAWFFLRKILLNVDPTTKALADKVEKQLAPYTGEKEVATNAFETWKKTQVGVDFFRSEHDGQTVILNPALKESIGDIDFNDKDSIISSMKDLQQHVADLKKRISDDDDEKKSIISSVLSGTWSETERERWANLGGVKTDTARLIYVKGENAKMELMNLLVRATELRGLLFLMDVAKDNDDLKETEWADLFSSALAKKKLVDLIKDLRFNDDGEAKVVFVFVFVFVFSHTSCSQTTISSLHEDIVRIEGERIWDQPRHSSPSIAHSMPVTSKELEERKKRLDEREEKLERREEKISTEKAKIKEKKKVLKRKAEEMENNTSSSSTMVRDDSTWEGFYNTSDDIHVYTGDFVPCRVCGQKSHKDFDFASKKLQDGDEGYGRFKKTCRNCLSSS